jgi:hypothetical protein
MFDLEPAIADWRKQMLAAGIKTPVPLEELESHLRDEIERLIKSGLNEAEAFKTGIHNIGQGRVLQNEFNKVETDHKMKRAIMLIIGWLAAGVTLLYGMFRFELNWNFFYFHPKWDLETIADVLIILVAETGIWLLAKASRDRASRVVSLLVCVFLAGLAVAFYYYDGLPRKGIFGGPVEPPPFWFRGGLALLMCLPGVFWILWTRRHLAQQRGPAHESQPIHSN